VSCVFSYTSKIPAACCVCNCRHRSRGRPLLHARAHKVGYTYLPVYLYFVQGCAYCVSCVSVQYEKYVLAAGCACKCPYKRSRGRPLLRARAQKVRVASCFSWVIYRGISIILCTYIMCKDVHTVCLVYLFNTSKIPVACCVCNCRHRRSRGRPLSHARARKVKNKEKLDISVEGGEIGCLGWVCFRWKHLRCHLVCATIKFQSGEGGAWGAHCHP
jgi:hypothetical protein